MKNLFWNADQRRPRTLWRLAVFLLISAVAFGALLLVAGLFGGLPNNGPWLALVEAATVVVGAWLAGRLVDRRSLAGFGFHLSRRWWLDLAFGMLLGALLMALIFAVEYAAGWVTVTSILWSPVGSFGHWFAYGVVGFIAVAIAEELATRGYLLRNLAEGLNWGPLNAKRAVIAAWAGTSVVFGVLHVFNPNATMVSTLSLMLAGLFLGLGFVLTGELAIPLGLHFTWNLFQGNVFGFPVSGGNAGVSVIAIRQGGPALWTGGPFGPEAGLMGIAAVLLGSLLIFLYVRWQYGRAELAMGLPERTTSTL